MADVDKITASNGTTYNIKDSIARESISHFTLNNIANVQIIATDTTFEFVVSPVSGEWYTLRFMSDNKIRFYKRTNGTWTMLWEK